MSKKIAELLPRLIADLQKRMGSKCEELYAVWARLLGPEMSPLARPVSFLEGVLTVEVKSAALYSCLCQYERQRLLASLKAECPGSGLHTLKFRRR